MDADFPHTPRTTSRTTSTVHPLMTAIGLGLPVTLLIDLIDPNGPRSVEMLEREGMSTDAVAGRVAAGARGVRTA